MRTRPEYMSTPIQRELIALPHATIQLHWPTPRGRFLTVLGPEYATRGQRLIVPEQIHGVGVVEVTRNTEASIVSNADGLVTTDPRVTLAAGGADCQVLVASAPWVSGILHAGWRGIRDNATEAFITALHQATPSKYRDNLLDELTIWVSPSVGPCHYRFAPTNPEGMSRVALFQAMFRPNVATRDGNEDLWQLNLREAQRMALARAGLDERQVNVDPRCTACAPEHFPSHVREGSGRRGTLMVTVTAERQA